MYDYNCDKDVKYMNNIIIKKAIKIKYLNIFDIRLRQVLSKTKTTIEE